MTTITKNQKRAFLIVVLAAFLLLVWMLRFYLWPFLLALLIYLILDELYIKLLNRVGKRAVLASSIMLTSILIVVFVPLGLLIGALAGEAVDVSIDLRDNISKEQIDGYLASDNIITETMAAANIDLTTLDDRAIEYLQNSSSSIFGGVKDTLLNSFHAVLDFFFMLVFLFFLFKDGERLKKRFYEIMPYPDELEKRIVHRMGSVAKDVFYGNIVITFLQGAAIGVALAILGIPHPILLGLLAGIFSLIPVVGTFIIWIPAMIYLWVQGDIVGAIALAVWSIGANTVLDNIVKPKILDKKLNLHPILIFFSLLGGLQVFGFVGILLGPLVAVLFISLWEIVRDWDSIKKELNIKEEA